MAANEHKGAMFTKFLFPPFSILRQNSGEWQARKKLWLNFGIKSEIGRDSGLTFTGGNKNTTDEVSKAIQNIGTTSIFDPVLCELMYKWFSKTGWLILDPFAGGSVRGVVAALTDRDYLGIDLSNNQIAANIINWENIKKDNNITNTGSIKWLNGDSNKVLDTINIKADLIFSCPPYADLEVYSKADNDISNMPYDEFLIAYNSIIKKSVDKLNDNRFIVWVVGEVRSKNNNGSYYNFISDTIKAFTDAGAEYYNDTILISPVGTLPLRAGRYFNTTRKLGKQHQNVLVFIKGDIKKAVKDLGSIEVYNKYFDNIGDN